MNRNADEVQMTTTMDGTQRPGRETIYLDVRTEREFEQAHVPGSINVPLHELSRRIPEVREVLARGEVTVVCRTGRRAGQACAELARSGLAGLRVLEGGIEAYSAAGGQVAHGRKAISIERQVRIAAGSLVVLGSVLAATVSPWFLALAGFVGAGLVFAGVTDTCGMALVLARAPWNRARRSTIRRVPGSHGA